MEELRNQLSSIMPPLDVGWQADATVNVALTSQPSLGVFERRHSMSLGAATMPRREQQQPGAHAIMPLMICLPPAAAAWQRCPTPTEGAYCSAITRVAEAHILFLAADVLPTQGMDSHTS